MVAAAPKLYCGLVGSSLVSYGSNTEVESKTILSSSTSALEPSGKVDDNYISSMNDGREQQAKNRRIKIIFGVK